MNTNLQSGQAMQSAHLDADQLNAFAEGALPEHERTATLAHLAECSTCREVAFLAQPPEALPHVRPVATPSGWRSWFAGSPLLGAAAAGLACTVLLAGVIHFRYLLAPDATPVPATPTQLAEQSAPAMPSAPVAPAAATPPPAAKVSPPPALKAPASVAPLRSDAAAPAPVRLAGAMPAEAPKVPASPLPAAAAKATGALKPQPAASDSVASGMPAAPPLPQPQQNFTAVGAGRGEVARNAAPAPPVLAPLPPATRTGASDAAGNSMQFANTLNIESINALPAYGRTEGRARNLQQQAALPSKLPVASQATSGGRMLAVDAQGSVFLSTDGGRHWRAVHAPWTGKAAQVAVAPTTRQFAAQLPPPPTAAAAPAAQNQDIATMGAAVSQTAAAAGQVQPNAFELTTTTQEIWVSTDGVNWRRGP